MRSITDTISRLQRLKPGLPDQIGSEARLAPLVAFGSNPGALRALLHVPADLPEGAPLVLVLHGCTQTAAGYDHGSGWSDLADRFGFAVLFAEQARANNPNLCFNWFVPADASRRGGEAESIAQMITATIERHHIDRTGVFVTGLSAGGAMTSVMLATYPELFAGGAIIAGLPYGVADSVSQALDRMRGHGFHRSALSDHVRGASPHLGPWPRVSVWHGTADAIVDPVNAAMIVDQWRGVHGVEGLGTDEVADGKTRRVWHGADGRAAIEHHAITAMGHGVPITSRGDEALGAAGPYMLDVGLSSTYRIAASWGIVPAVAPTQREASAGAAPLSNRLGTETGPRFDPSQIINEALRSAGLIRP